MIGGLIVLARAKKPR
jgi:putative addiction module component (TIGR02574 family)